MIENQKNTSFNPLLTSTSRQFYTRRLPQRQHSNAQLEKVLRVLNSSQGEKNHRKFKTQNREETFHFDSQLDNLKKMAKVKLLTVMKKEGKQWKQLFEVFENYTKSSSKEILLKNEINFLLKMGDLIKKMIKKSGSEQNENVKMKEVSSKMFREKDKILETVRLSKQNQILREKLSIFQSFSPKLEEQKSSTQELKLNSQDWIEDQIQHQKFCSESKLLSELKAEVQILRGTNDILREQKKKMQEKNLELKSNNQNLCQEIVKSRYFSSQSKQKIEMWRNIMLMQNEQINSLKRDLQDLKKQFNDLNRKYHNILKRFSSLSSKDQTRITEITKKNVELFNQQIEAFQKIRNRFIFKGYYQVSGAAKEKGVNVYQRYLGEKESISNVEGIKKIAKDYYTYYKPSFFVFLEQYFQYQGVDRQNFDQIGLPVDMNFLATLRSIFDSKFNEYLLDRKSSRHISSLSNFTLSWLSNFMVNRKSKEQEQITTDVCFQTIGGFYIRLMNPKLNNNWEVITFRQFLLQSLTIDQLVFYLKTRFLLLKGDGMSGKGAFMPIFYVNYVDALLLIQQIVSDFDYRKKLEDYLKRTAQYHRKNHLIDSHFILRLLLEYYQFKKQQTFATLSKAFSPYLKERNISMPFQVYLKIFDYNSFELSLTQMVQIFQKAFSLGRGSVHLENIFTVINEEGFLCGDVQKMFEKHPMEKNNEVSLRLCEYQKNDPILDQFRLFCEKSLTKQISRIGLQTQKITISKLIQQKTLTAEGMFRKIETIFDISMFNIKKLFFSKSVKKFSQEELSGLIPIWMPFLKEIVKSSIQKKQSLVLLETFLKKQAAKQILHFYRRKKFLVRSFISSCDQKDKNNEHATQIRKEFNSLIQNLKVKYKNNVSLTSEKDVEYDQSM